MEACLEQVCKCASVLEWTFIQAVALENTVKLHL